MRVYETTFIINPQTDDATIDRQVKDIADIITGTEGKIIHEDHMGTRRMAYPIKRLAQGYYASFIFEAPSEVLPKMERHFKLNEAYLRHLTVIYEGEIKDGVVQTQADIFARRDGTRENSRYQRDNRQDDDERDSRPAPSRPAAPAADTAVADEVKEEAVEPNVVEDVVETPTEESTPVVAEEVSEESAPEAGNDEEDEL